MFSVLSRLAREPASFWQENVVAVVTPLREEGNFSENVEVGKTSYQMLEVLSFL